MVRKQSHRSKCALIYFIMILSFVFIMMSGCGKRKLTQEEVWQLCYPPEEMAKIEAIVNVEQSKEPVATESNAQKDKETYSPYSCITLSPDELKELKRLKRKDFIEDIFYIFNFSY